MVAQIRDVDASFSFYSLIQITPNNPPIDTLNAPIGIDIYLSSFLIHLCNYSLRMYIFHVESL